MCSVIALGCRPYYFIYYLFIYIVIIKKNVMKQLLKYTCKISKVGSGKDAQYAAHIILENVLKTYILECSMLKLEYCVRKNKLKNLPFRQ